MGGREGDRVEVTVDARKKKDKMHQWGGVQNVVAQEEAIAPGHVRRLRTRHFPRHIYSPVTPNRCEKKAAYATRVFIPPKNIALTTLLSFIRWTRPTRSSPCITQWETGTREPPKPRIASRREPPEDPHRSNRRPQKNAATDGERRHEIQARRRHQ